jgi:membrane-associated phospholipid phosphatase
MDFELEIIVWLQSFRSDFFDALFQFFTMFGEELVIIGILGFIYWCYDKKTGEQIGITVFISLVLNSVIKTIVQRQRPYLVDSRIDNVRPATSGGYSFPSGHTQGAASVFGSLAIWMKKRWLTVVATVIIVLVAISRMYIGVHFLSDVIVGGLLGVGIAYLGYRYFSKDRSTDKLYRYLLIGSIAIGILFYIYSLFTIQATDELNNAANLHDKLVDVLKMLGVICGFIAGVTFEKSKVKFTQHKVLWKNLIRFALGVAVVMGVRLGLKVVFGIFVDSDELAEGELFLASLALLFDTLRYFAMVFIGIGVYPMIFKSLDI